MARIVQGLRPGVAHRHHRHMADVCVWFNPRCSKCRQSRDLLEEQGVDAELFHYLDESPGREQIEEVMGMLGITDPREMMRTGEDAYGELGLAGAGRDQLIDAMVAHPILVERPIVIRDGKAVIARPPEKLLDLL
jgi:arsenate reductase